MSAGEDRGGPDLGRFGSESWSPGAGAATEEVDLVYRLLADAVVVSHFAFVVFVILGGLLALRWPKSAWIHVPAALWGGVIELAGWVCPLTPLEVRLRILGGQAGYEGGFVEHYLIPILYPRELTRDLQMGLGVAVILLNLTVYMVVWRRWRGRSSPV